MRIILLMCLVVLLCSCQSSRNSDASFEKPENPGLQAQPVTLNEQEQAFKTMLNGARLNGSFSMNGKHAIDGVANDSYVISSMEKVSEHRWRLMVRIRYLHTDVNVPLFLPVKWAGDTAVIYVDKVLIPGVGTYSARVLFYDDQYAGVWEGDGYGGQLMGSITPLDDAAAPQQ